MEYRLVWVFILTFVSKILLTTSNHEINIGHFQVLRGHFEILKCANEVLHQDEYVGGRISHLTGECTGLSHSWGRNQIIETGYGYVKKISVQKPFEPPAEVPYREKGSWTTRIPGILNTGARIDLHLTGQTEGSQTIIAGANNRISIGESVRLHERTVVGFPKTFYYSTEWKISIVAQYRSLQVLVDDKVLTTTNVTAARLNYLTTIVANSNSEIFGNGLFIRRFGFSEEYETCFIKKKGDKNTFCITRQYRGTRKCQTTSFNRRSFSEKCDVDSTCDTCKSLYQNLTTQIFCSKLS